MISWMIYAVLVASVLSAAAITAERAARVHRRNTRWIWLAALACSLALPVLITSVTLRLPGVIHSGVMPPPIALRNTTSIAMPAMLVDLGGVSLYGTHDNVTALIREGWLTLSILMLCALMASSVLLQRRKRGWAEALVLGESVLVAPDMGPAVAGLLRPRIVVPPWLLQASESRQRAVMAHESSHIQAGDPRLIALATLLLVSMPWNPLLWWQFRRLRRAIEVDCDGRVLRDGGNIGEYCETLIHVGQIQSSRVGLMPAMSQPGSFLEQRIKLMLARPKRWAGLTALALVCMSLGIAAFAAQMTPPVTTTHVAVKTVKLTTALLDRYVGYYRLSGTSRVGVTREGNGLRLVVTAQPSAAKPFYALPLGADRFALQGTDLIIGFRMDAHGRVQQLDVLTNGHAMFSADRVSLAEGQRIDAALAARIKAQKPFPGSQEVLQLLLNDPVSGAGMSKDVAHARTRQRASGENYLARLGPVQSYSFTGVNHFGDDVYRVNHAHGIETVILAVGPLGILGKSVILMHSSHGILVTAVRHT